MSRERSRMLCTWFGPVEMVVGFEAEGWLFSVSANPRRV